MVGRGQREKQTNGVVCGGRMLVAVAVRVAQHSRKFLTAPTVSRTNTLLLYISRASRFGVRENELGKHGKPLTTLESSPACVYVQEI